MPTFTHGKNAKILANGYDLSAYFSSVSQSGSSETAEVTTLGNASKAYIPGTKDATFSVEGFYDATAGAVDEVMEDVLGASTVWTAVMSADAIGARGYGALTLGTSIETGAEIGGAVSLSAEAQATTGPDAVTVLHPLGAETTSGNGTQVDNGASTANGLAAYLHVTAIAGTPSLVVKVQHSSDGSTWVDLATFSTVTTANVAQRVTVSGTVNRYLRALWTISGGTPSATFHMSAARL
jgi:hypothetical protein